MCCLRYEHEFYVQQRKRFPKEGKIIETSKGEQKVVSNDIFRERVTLRGIDGEVNVVPLAEFRRDWLAAAPPGQPLDEDTSPIPYEAIPDEVLRMQDTSEMPAWHPGPKRDGSPSRPLPVLSDTPDTRGQAPPPARPQDDAIAREEGSTVAKSSRRRDRPERDARPEGGGTTRGERGDRPGRGPRRERTDGSERSVRGEQDRRRERPPRAGADADVDVTASDAGDDPIATRAPMPESPTPGAPAPQASTPGAPAPEAPVARSGELSDDDEQERRLRRRRGRRGGRRGRSGDRGDAADDRSSGAEGAGQDQPPRDRPPGESA